MKTFATEKNFYSFPENYDEIKDREQCLKILQVVFSGKYTYPQAISIACNTLLPIPQIAQKLPQKIIDQYKNIARLARTNRPTNQQILLNALSEHFLWIFQPKISKNVIKYLNINKKKYTLPTENLENVSIYAWHYAAQYLYAFNKTQDQAYIDKLLACLILPENTPFNPEQIENNLPHISALPDYLKALIHQYIIIQWDSLFKNFESIFDKSKADTPPDYSSIIFELAKTQVFGTVEETGKQPISTCLLFLKKQKEQAESQKT